MKTRHIALLALAALTLLATVPASAQNRGNLRRGQRIERTRTTENNNVNSDTRSNTNTNTNATTGSRPSSTTTNNSAGSRPTSTQSYGSIKQYLESTEYKNKENLKALTETGEALKDLPDVVVNNEGAFVLHKVKRDINNSTNEFFGTEESVVFPGNLVYINQQLADGDPVPCNFSPGKVQLTINMNLGAGRSTTATVENSYGKVHDQIVTWLNEKGESMIGTLDASGNINYYSSSYQMSVDLKVSVDYLKTHAHVNMNTTKNELKIVSVEDFTQKFYSVSATPVNNDVATLFGSGTTAATVQSGVQANGPIGMISNVSYGRRAYRFREYTQNDFTLTGDEQVKYSGTAKVDAKSEHSVTTSDKCSKFWGFVQGGYEGDKEIFNDTEASDKSNSKFMQALTADTKVSAYNPGVALNYTVRFLMNNSAAKRNSTGQYWETTYTACPRTITFELHKDASQVAASSLAYKLNYKVIHVVKDRAGNVTSWEIWDAPRTSGAKKADKGYVDYFQHDFSQGETRKTRVIPTNDTPDKENCYIYGDLYYRLQGNHRAGGGWDLWEEGWISPAVIPTEANGKIARIYIGGSNYGNKSPYINSKSDGKTTQN